MSELHYQAGYEDGLHGRLPSYAGPARYFAAYTAGYRDGERAATCQTNHH